MARTNVPVTEITRAGVAPANPITGDPTNNHAVANDGHVVLLIANTGATVARTATVRVTRTVDGQTPASRTYSIAQSTSRYIGPWPTGDYGTTLQVDVDNAELKLSAYRIG